MSTTPDLARKLAPLVALQRDLQEKLAALTQEMDDILGGKASIGAKLKDLEARWQTTWASRYVSQYVFDYVKDRAQLKRLLRSFSVEDLGERMVRYVSDNDAFYVRARHPFRLFVSTVNRWAPEPSDGGDRELAPVDCRHTPRCQTERACTGKTHAARMRA